MRHHQFRSVGASGIRYSVVPLHTQVSPEEKERGEQWKGFAGEIRHEVRNVAEMTSALVAQQRHVEATTAARLLQIEETTAARLSQIEETTATIAAQQKVLQGQLERLLEAFPKTTRPEGSLH